MKDKGSDCHFVEDLKNHQSDKSSFRIWLCVLEIFKFLIMSEDVRCHLVEIKLIKTWLGDIIDGLACCLQHLESRGLGFENEATPITYFTESLGQTQTWTIGGGGGRGGDTWHAWHFVTSYDSESWAPLSTSIQLMTMVGSDQPLNCTQIIQTVWGDSVER